MGEVHRPTRVRFARADNIPKWGFNDSCYHFEWTRAKLGFVTVTSSLPFDAFLAHVRGEFALRLTSVNLARYGLLGVCVLYVRVLFGGKLSKKKCTHFFVVWCFA